MKNHQINIVTNNTRLRQEEQTHAIFLVIPRLPDNLEEVAEPRKLEELRSSSFGARPSWKDVDSARWHPICDGEVANLMRLAPVESITDEQYGRFSQVVVPSFGASYKGFSGEEMPPLDWIKQSFSSHVAVAQYWRHESRSTECLLSGASQNEIDRFLTQPDCHVPASRRNKKQWYTAAHDKATEIQTEATAREDRLP